MNKLIFFVIFVSLIFSSSVSFSYSDMDSDIISILVAKSIRTGKEEPIKIQKQKRWEEMTPEERQESMRKIKERIESKNTKQKMNTLNSLEKGVED